MHREANHGLSRNEDWERRFSAIEKSMDCILQAVSEAISQWNGRSAQFFQLAQELSEATCKCVVENKEFRQNMKQRDEQLMTLTGAVQQLEADLDRLAKELANERANHVEELARERSSRAEVFTNMDHLNDAFGQEQVQRENISQICHTHDSEISEIKMHINVLNDNMQIVINAISDDHANTEAGTREAAGSAELEKRIKPKDEFAYRIEALSRNLMGEISTSQPHGADPGTQPSYDLYPSRNLMGESPTSQSQRAASSTHPSYDMYSSSAYRADQETHRSTYGDMATLDAVGSRIDDSRNNSAGLEAYRRDLMTERPLPKDTDEPSRMNGAGNNALQPISEVSSRAELHPQPDGEAGSYEHHPQQSWVLPADIRRVPLMGRTTWNA